jgi:hypothetical protein
VYLAQIFEAAERGDDLLAHRPVLATVLDDLEIGATAGVLLVVFQPSGERGARNCLPSRCYKIFPDID